MILNHVGQKILILKLLRLKIKGLEELEGLKGFEGFKGTEELRKLNPSTLSSLIQSSTVPSGTIVPRQVWTPHS